jgi:hypothetical protein
VGYLKGIFLRPLAKLVYRTVVEGGWRDGWRGLLKISLDVGSDALVWSSVLVRRDGPQVPAGAHQGSHFGQRRAGPARIVAVADRGLPAQRAAEWLGALRRGGVDVALISEQPATAEQPPMAGQPPTTERIPQRAVARIRPLAVIRALETERQVRIVDAVVPFGRRSRLLHRVLPHTLRPRIPGLDSDVDPGQALTLIRSYE